MKPIVVREHARIVRGTSTSSDARGATVEERLYERLRRYDRDGRHESDRVFEWHDGFASTAQWVGVVQVSGLQVEILPKIDVPGASAEWGDTAQFEARRNLLYMLSVGGDVPVRSRDVARLATRKAPLSETLAAIFAHRLRQELLLGPERAYLQREENLRCFKGKLQIPDQVRFNAAHRERFYCRFDELLDDTPMNRIFRAACQRLHAVTKTPATQDVLRQCLLLLDGVSDVEVQEADFSGIGITRQNQRFEEVLRFCRLILAGRSPTIEAGQTRAFSLLFDMNVVFERFIAAMLRIHVAPRIGDVQVFPQAARHSRHLLESKGAGVLRLAPDVLIEGFGRAMVLDTKWKPLTPGKRGRGGVGNGDLYQLYAYARRYGCRQSVLLYPHMPGLQARDFDVLGADHALSGERIAIRQVGLHRNLCVESERERLVVELEAIVREGLAAAHTVAAEPPSATNPSGDAA